MNKLICCIKSTHNVEVNYIDFPEIILPIVAGFLFASFHFFLKKAKDKILIQCIGKAITGVVLMFLSIFFENDNVTYSAIWLLLMALLNNYR